MRKSLIQFLQPFDFVLRSRKIFKFENRLPAIKLLWEVDQITYIFLSVKYSLSSIVHTQFVDFLVTRLKANEVHKKSLKELATFQSDFPHEKYGEALIVKMR
jgi:hypothetical protein